MSKVPGIGRCRNPNDQTPRQEETAKDNTKEQKASAKCHSKSQLDGKTTEATLEQLRQKKQIFGGVIVKKGN